MDNKTRNRKNKSRKSLFPIVILTIVMLALIVGLARFYREYTRDTREGHRINRSESMPFERRICSGGACTLQGSDPLKT